MRISFGRLEHAVGAALAFIACMLYVLTLCPTVNFIDSGELAADVYTLGIAHPTGYPLFTLIGNIVAHLPLGFRVIYQLNLMAALLCAGGVYVFFRFMLFFASELYRPGGKERSGKDEAVPAGAVVHLFVPAAFGALVLAFSETYWSQALSIEVYPLHVLFLGLLLLLFAKAMHANLRSDAGQRAGGRKNVYWSMFAFVLGLSFTNHGTTILLAPAFLTAYFYTFGLTRHDSWKGLLHLGIPFLLGYSVLLYLPLRASAGPLMNWGDPQTLEKLLWHIRGRQYTVWLFESWETAAKQLSYFITTLPEKFAYVPLAIAALGAWRLFRVQRSLFVFTALLFLGCLAYAINYDIHDIDSYFLLAYVTISLWCVPGVMTILSGLRNGSARRWVSVCCILSTALMPLVNYANVDESRLYVVEDYTRDVLRSVKQGGIILSYQWDYFVSASFYLQLVEKERTDVTVIDKELLRRSWYLHVLEVQHPQLLQQSRAEREAYARELYKFEHSLPYDANMIEFRYASFIRSIIEKNIRSKPVYVTQEIEPQYTAGYQRVPAGLAFRLYADTSYHEEDIPEMSLRIPSQRDPNVDGLLSLYARSYYDIALYATQHGNLAEARSALEKALEARPEFPEALALRTKITGQP